jgi:beta-lactamase class A
MATGLMVVAAALVAGGTAAAGGAPPPAPQAPDRGAATTAARQPGVRPAEQVLGRAFVHRVEARPGGVSIAVADLSSHRTWVLHRHARAYTASIVKLPILLQAMRRSGRRGLSPAQDALARRMIEHSDNDAATALWRVAGRQAGMFRLFDRLGLTATRQAPTLFEPWDGVRTTALDQLRVLAALARGVPGVTPPERRRVLRLMRHVEPDQDWGAGRLAVGGATVAVKNGWVPVGRQGWTVNTIGLLAYHSRPVLSVAVLTTGSPSEQAGVHTVDLVCRRLLRGLRATSAGAPALR